MEKNAKKPDALLDIKEMAGVKKNVTTLNVTSTMVIVLILKIMTMTNHMR
jgi:hypothetical protein